MRPRSSVAARVLFAVALGAVAIKFRVILEWASHSSTLVSTEVTASTPLPFSAAMNEDVYWATANRAYAVSELFTSLSCYVQFLVWANQDRLTFTLWYDFELLPGTVCRSH